MNNPQYSRLVQFIRRVEDNFFRTCTSKVKLSGLDQWDCSSHSCDSSFRLYDCLVLSLPTGRVLCQTGRQIPAHSEGAAENLWVLSPVVFFFSAVFCTRILSLGYCSYVSPADPGPGGNPIKPGPNAPQMDVWDRISAIPLQVPLPEHCLNSIVPFAQYV